MNEEQTTGSEVLPVVALRNMVVFPGVMTGLRIGRPRSVQALEEALGADRRLMLVTQHEAETEEPGPDDLYRVGVVGRVHGNRVDEDGVHATEIEAEQRCRIVDFEQMAPYVAARVEPLRDVAEEVPHELRARVRRLFQSTRPGQALLSMLEGMEEPPPLEFVVAYVLELSVEDKQGILAEPSPLNRYRMLVPLLQVERQIAAAGERIRRESEEVVTEQDRRKYLEEKKEQILNRLSEMGAETAEAHEMRERIEAAQLPPKAAEEAERELTRLEQIPSSSPEYSVVVDYLEWLSELPWAKTSDSVVDLQRARRVLDRDHYDRSEVKERILEYLSVRKLNPEREGAILCFVGAPGVGKTSMGRSIAEATERRFHRVSLGGVRDESEVRGHRRTYIGALPGRIIRALRTVGVRNPVLMLDEVDKIQAGVRGDPTSALLEVLDPDQNDEFVDNYLAVPFDLSQIMFIGTANTTDTVPGPLLDRMEVIELSGYTTEEKIAIAGEYLVPKQLRATGLQKEQVEFSGDALRTIVERYTREAGVRNLERRIGAVLRKLVREQMGRRTIFGRVTPERVVDLLGPPERTPERREKAGQVGVCPTLTISVSGGDLLLVEVIRAAGKGKLMVTGRAGEVLKESARLAFTYWKSRAERYGFDASVLGESDFHVHFPAAARPKEGASAGLPIALAFASLLSDQPLPPDVAALGEITLRGRVLGVERLSERLAAAGRADVERVIVPERDRAQIEAVSDRDYLAELELLYVETLDDALELVLPHILRTSSAAGPELRAE